MSDSIEIEARFIGLDQGTVEAELKKLGAEKQFESMFREWIFRREEWTPFFGRVRVRDDGRTVWLTYKANPTWAVDSTEEIEVEVSSSEEAAKFIQKVGVPLVRYQEKKRIQYRLEDIAFELDFWPKIPMVLEIESVTKEKVMHGAKLLGLDWTNAIFVDQLVLHKQFYNIDLNDVQDYRF